MAVYWRRTEILKETRLNLKRHSKKLLNQNYMKIKYERLDQELEDEYEVMGL